MYIDLSNNKLTVFQKHAIYVSRQLSYLSLENNSLNVKMSKEALDTLNINFIESDLFSLCCLSTGNVKCSAKKPFQMPCSHLLIKSIIHYAFCFVSCVVIVNNTIHLLLQWRRLVERQNTNVTKVCDYIITSISYADITGSVPLLILWISDLYFKTYLVFSEDQWKSSIVCFAFCGINTYYSLVSPFLYVLLSFARYQVVKDPINSNFKKSKYVFKIIFVGCSFSFFFATLITTLFWQHSNGYLRDFATLFLTHLEHHF